MVMIHTRQITFWFEPDESGGYSAAVLELPGCVSEGETLEEAYANIADALSGVLDSHFRSGTRPEWQDCSTTSAGCETANCFKIGDEPD